MRDAGVALATTQAAKYNERYSSTDNEMQKDRMVARANTCLAISDAIAALPLTPKEDGETREH